MATGFFLILMGIQLHVVESFTMTPRVSHFVNDNFSQRQLTPAATVIPPSAEAPLAQRQNYNSPYYQTSYGQPVVNSAAVAPRSMPLSSAGQSTIAPPRWFCWPVLFLGAFLLLQGATKPRD